MPRLIRKHPSLEPSGEAGQTCSKAKNILVCYICKRLAPPEKKGKRKKKFLGHIVQSASHPTLSGIRKNRLLFPLFFQTIILRMECYSNSDTVFSTNKRNGKRMRSEIFFRQIGLAVDMTVY